LTKQDEKLRLRRRLQDQAVDQAAKNRWEEAVETNLQLISLGEDADTRNRLGKAYFELGKLTDAREAYDGSVRRGDDEAPLRSRVLDPFAPTLRAALFVEGVEKLVGHRAAIGRTPRGDVNACDLVFITDAGVTNHRVEVILTECARSS